MKKCRMGKYKIIPNERADGAERGEELSRSGKQTDEEAQPQQQQENSTTSIREINRKKANTEINNYAEKKIMERQPARAAVSAGQ